MGIFHVHKFSIEGHGAAGGEGSAALLRHVWDAHAGGAVAQAPEEGVPFQEYGDADKT